MFNIGFVFYDFYVTVAFHASTGRNKFTNNNIFFMGKIDEGTFNQEMKKRFC